MVKNIGVEENFSSQYINSDKISKKDTIAYQMEYLPF